MAVGLAAWGGWAVGPVVEVQSCAGLEAVSGPSVQLGLTKPGQVRIKVAHATSAPLG